MYKTEGNIEVICLVLCLWLHSKMWKLAFPFLAVLLAVGFGQEPEGLIEVAANDPEVQEALRFAIDEYNKASTDIYLYKAIKVIKVQRKVCTIWLMRLYRIQKVVNTVDYGQANRFDLRCKHIFLNCVFVHFENSFRIYIVGEFLLTSLFQTSVVFTSFFLLKQLKKMLFSFLNVCL